MAKKPRSKGVDRRSFITGVATAGAAAVAAKPGAAAAAQPPQKLAPPSPIEIAAETAQVQFAPNDRYHVRNPGSDFMVDVIKSLPFEYVATIPGNTFRGLHESLVNYGGNKNPELISVAHEEVSGAMAHGYAKIAGKPMALMVHNTVGLQHASMALYDAWADRVPMMVIVGNADFDATKRPGLVDWEHSATDVAAMVRGFIKYDDQPVSLGHFVESFVRAYSLSMTPPMEPVVIVADGSLQEESAESKPAIPKYVPVRPPAGDATAVADAAKLIVAAKNPVIFAERAARTPAGLRLTVQLAELLQAPVVDMMNRMNFPSNHYLNQTFNQGEIAGGADVILALECDNLFGTVGTVVNVPGYPTRMRVKPGTKVISINSQYAASAGNYQDKQRFYQADLPVAGDAEATLPMLIDAVQQEMSAARRAENPARAARWQGLFHRRRIADRNLAANGWDATPISVPRMCMEIWEQIKGHDWAMVSGAPFQSYWPQRLWDITKAYQYSGWAGAYGVGYGLPAAVGAALALKGMGDAIAVNIQGDGDFMMLPAALWTATHHRIPLLTIMHNNRAWHQELMFVTQMADQRDRPATLVGTTIDDPAPNYAMIARGFGMYAEGPITSPDALGPALARAIKIVKSGHPALIDVVTQGR
jgi:thiamine pyrophosphate-dependent acetolactate synthase large subunit-like protein